MNLKGFEVSKAWRKLQQSYGEVRRLYADLQPTVFSRQAWTGLVYARQTLGAEVTVEIWYLAQHFLVAWSDWRGLAERYLRYYGQTEEKFPKSWRKLEANCQSLIERIARDSELDELIADDWLIPNVISRLIGKADDSPRRLFHLITQEHRHLALIERLESQAERPQEYPARVRTSGPVLPKSAENTRRLNQALMSLWQDLPARPKADALWYLRNYQHAHLAASWLYDKATAAVNVGNSAFLFATFLEQTVPLSIDGFVEQLELESVDRQTVVQLLERLQTAIAEFGYADFLEDLLSDGFLGGADSPLATDRFNLIPGRRKTACCTTLLAVSKGEKRAIGFPNVMRQVRGHLIECMHKTKVVIVMCDHWKSDMLAEHLEDLRAHHARGVRFLFLLVGTPGRAVAPVAVDLGLSP